MNTDAFTGGGDDRMDSAEETRFLGRFPEHLRRYRDSVAANDPESEQRSRMDLCSDLEYFLDAHLRRCRGWAPGAWVDGVLPVSLDVTDRGVATVAGSAVWYGRHETFLDPFFSRIELSQDWSSVRSYSMCFGDAEAGLGKYVYKQPSKDLYRPPPASWYLAFGGTLP